MGFARKGVRRRRCTQPRRALRSGPGDLRQVLGLSDFCGIARRGHTHCFEGCMVHTLDGDSTSMTSAQGVPDDDELPFTD
jgi:hypothetical protein